MACENLLEGHLKESEAYLLLVSFFFFFFFFHKEKVPTKTRQECQGFQESLLALLINCEFFLSYYKAPVPSIFQIRLIVVAS